MENQDEEQYLCVGICMADPDSGYCLGCGRPPLGAPAMVAEAVTQTFQPDNVSTESDRPE
ncbi:MAG: DUF1289 domain-containing protein [Azonexus sp.]|nr:DUF1289 domain-containing protein [Azonexus sp.]MDP3636418.1 DUF1289 domain-containing protein [Azonexus sp.]MDZ4313305.1 DUF1289 domain-containing protein [Azonexus sp.]